MTAVRVFLSAFVLLCFLGGVGSAHAQLMPPPVVSLGPAGANNANVVACSPQFTGIAGRSGPCTFTITTPNVVDLQCIQFTNIKTLSAVPTTAGATCTLAQPNTTITLTFNSPGLGDGSIVGVFNGFRTGGILTMSSGLALIPDASNPRFFQLAICPVRALTVPFDDPLCPVTINGALPNDFQNFEFPNQ